MRAVTYTIHYTNERGEYSQKPDRIIVASSFKKAAYMASKNVMTSYPHRAGCFKNQRTYNMGGGHPTGVRMVVKRAWP
jgi:hypothetical protein